LDILGKMAIIFGLLLGLMFIMASCNKTTVQDTSVGIDDEAPPEQIVEAPVETVETPVEAPQENMSEAPVETPETPNATEANETEIPEPETPPVEMMENPCPIDPPADAVLIEGQYDEYFMERHHMLGEFSKSVGAYLTWYDEAHERPRTITCYSETGKKTGLYKEWDANNFLITEAFYLENKPDGPWAEWFNGYIKEEKEYVNGTLHGIYKFYYNSGDAIGTIKEEGQYYEGKKDGTWTNYHFSNGAVREVFGFDRGLELGDYTKYFDDGSLNIMKRGEFVNGQFNGYITTWTSSGDGENCTYVGGDVIHNGCVAI